MHTAAHAQDAGDRTEVLHVTRSAILLGVVQTVIIAAAAMASRALAGPAEAVVLGLLVFAGIVVTTFAPGLWTEARTIEGIAGAAGIGLAATVVFLVLDVAVLQPLGMYTNRWHAIGGGSNWWYHPVFWMVGAYLPWMGAWILANQAARSGRASLVGAVLLGLVATVVVAVAAILLGFPGAGWNVATFGVASLAGLPLAVLVSARGRAAA